MSPVVGTDANGSRPVLDGLSDVLTVSEFMHETTEALMEAAPSISGEQIVKIRQRLAVLAQSHGWIEA